MNKWVLSLSLAAGVIGLAGCSGSNGAVVETKAGDITKDQLYEAMKDKYGEETLRQLVIDKVLSKEYKVSDKEVDEQLDEVKSQIGPQFEMALAQYGYKDESEFREALRLNLLQEKAAMKDIKASEKDVKAYYDAKKPDIEVRHILVEDEAKAKDLIAKLDKGEDFAKLAKENSTDPGTAEQGGELGFVSQDDQQLDAAFKEAAFKLKKDEISAPVQSSFGWHIIQVTDIKKKESFDKVKDKMEREYKLSKLDADKAQNALKNELKKSDIKIEDKELKDTFDGILTSDKEKETTDKKESK